MEGSLKKYLLLFVCIAAQLNLLQSQKELSPAQLLEELLEDSCHPENATAFYLNIREMQNVTSLDLHPSWEYGDTGLPGTPVLGRSGDVLLLTASFEGFFGDLFFSAINGNAPSYTWCVYLLSENLGVHGCISGNHTLATPAFERLGLMDKLTTEDVGVSLGVPSYVVLKINTSGGYQYPSGHSLWNKAMVCVTIGWNDRPSSGQCLILNVKTEVGLYITDISTQEDSFLVTGVQKTLYCEIYGTYDAFNNGWRKSPGMDIPQRGDDCDAKNNCQDMFFYDLLLNSKYCQLEGQLLTLVTSHVVLDFRNPTIEDVGEYVCFVRSRDIGENDLQNTTTYLYVVFVEVFEMALPYYQEGELRCTVKAPSNATVTIQQNGQEITRQYNPEDFSDSCNDLPQIFHSVKVLDDHFSMFSIQIKICHVTGKNVGTYQCLVEYSIPTDSRPQQAQITTHVTIEQRGNIFEVESPLSAKEATGIGLSILALCLILIAIGSVTLCMLSTKMSRKQLFHRRTRAQDWEPSSLSFTNQNPICLKLTPVSPGGDRGNTDCMEFARDHLKFHQELGKGRFGKVMLASAYNIVPHMPTLNQVAVKMAISNTPQNNDLILTELEVMKQLGSNKYICNLLAYCTVDEPVFIIMEYALHGNLKEYLNLCRESVLQSGQPFAISHADADHSICVCNDGGGSDSDEKQPGLLSEADVRNFAFQVACGLEHLKTMNVVHCDLAARNVLVCEGFLLKIGDFGLARKTSSNHDYQNIIAGQLEEVVAVKWAPVEALESKGYTFKSDVWSYAVIIWEIATYGEKPFSDHKIGISLNRFVQFLRAGHRLPQPNGLSDSIYEMLLRCWSVAPSDRPSSTDLMQFFQEHTYYNS